MYFRICGCCGATLDPGEVCDCKSEESKRPGRDEIKECED